MYRAWVVFTVGARITRQGQAALATAASSGLRLAAARLAERPALQALRRARPRATLMATVSYGSTVPLLALCRRAFSERPVAPRGTARLAWPGLRARALGFARSWTPHRKPATAAPPCPPKRGGP